MRSIGIVFTLLLVFLSACIPNGVPVSGSTSTLVPTIVIPTPVTPSPVTSTPTETPVPTTPVVPTPTGTPGSAFITPSAAADAPGGASGPTPTELPYTQCGWVWATQALPQVSAQLKQLYQDAGTADVEVSASAYGENCLDQSGQVNHFSAMETDFNFSVPVKDTKDAQALGDWIAKLVPVIQKVPKDQLPGPNPAKIFIRFIGQTDEANLSFARSRAEELLQQGLSGSALYDALKPNP